MPEYNPADPSSILEFAKKLRGKRLKEIAECKFKGTGGAVHGKAEVGHFYERYFGIKSNSSPEPDFPLAGVELKIVPIVTGARGIRVKERTKISLIDYNRLVSERWETASVRKKISTVLFIFYEWLPGKDKSEFITKETILWKPEASDERFFRADWSTVWQLVYDGKAHQLSESRTDYLSACTAGRDSKDTIPQPHSSELAKRRAWALKPAFTRQIWEATISGVEFESLVENLKIKDVSSFDHRIIEHLRMFEGRSIGELAKRFDVSETDAKQYKAMVIRRCLGAKRGEARIEEFEKQGIELHVVPVNARTHRLFEAISFPRFRHKGIVFEKWEESDLRQDTQKILFVPVYGEDKKQVDSFKLGRAFFWSPDTQQEEEMCREWEMFVNLIRDGKADKLPTAKTTEIIHVRPKARNGADKEEAPHGISVVKKCFWLNQRFVEQLIEKNGKKS